MNFTTTIVDTFNESLIPYSESAKCVNWCQSVHFANDYEGMVLILIASGALTLYYVFKDSEFVRQEKILIRLFDSLPFLALVMLFLFIYLFIRNL